MIKKSEVINQEFNENFEEEKDRSSKMKVSYE
jgi:hypothetical protein